MKENEFIAVDAGTEWTGVVVYWSLHGSVYHSTLEDCCEEHGVDTDRVCSPDSLPRALKNAMQRHTNASTLLRTLGRNKGFALVSEETDEEVDLRHSVALSVKIHRSHNPDGTTKQTLVFAPDLHPQRGQIQEDVKVLMDQIDSGRFGRWLTSFIVSDLQGVSLRPSGGMYFIPSQHVAAWENLREALREASDHELFEIPAARSEEAVQALLGAVTAEARVTAETMFKELHETEEWGSRAMATKKRQCAEMHTKLDAYEDLLGVSLEEMREQMNQVKAALAAATLVSDMEDVG